MTAPTHHASGILLGHRGILIRGPSGVGKSKLALSLLQGTGKGFSRLVGDDRIHLQASHGRLLMRPALALQGLIEIRGLGVVRMPFEPVAVVHLIVDLDASDAARLPAASAMEADIEGVRLARLPVAPGAQADRLVLAILQHSAGASGPCPA